MHIHLYTHFTLYTLHIINEVRKFKNKDKCTQIVDEVGATWDIIFFHSIKITEIAFSILIVAVNNGLSITIRRFIPHCCKDFEKD